MYERTIGAACKSYFDGSADSTRPIRVVAISKEEFGVRATVNGPPT